MHGISRGLRRRACAGSSGIPRCPPRLSRTGFGFHLRSLDIADTILRAPALPLAGRAGREWRAWPEFDVISREEMLGHPDGLVQIASAIRRNAARFRDRPAYITDR